MDKIDGVLFAFAGLASIWLAYLLLRQGVRPGWPLLLLVVFWLLFTYLLLPRLHRVLTRLYVPDYFIGRTRTADGLLGDPVNLAVLGHEGQIHRAMEVAGWIRADDLTAASGRRMVGSTLTRRSYPHAPVSPLLLFDRQQDFAYQQEVGGSTSQRHHIRFWRCPEGWMLPGGYSVDWLAAGTYDRSVGFSLFTFQITHKIEANTDIERDYVVSTVTGKNPDASLQVIKDFSTGYHSRNGGGDLIKTDGDLPILDLRAVSAPIVPDEELSDSRDKRPFQTVFGSVVAMLRGVGTIVLGLLVLLAGHLGVATLSDDSGADVTVDTITATIVGIFLLVGGVIDLVLGLATLRGRNIARLLVMLYCVLATISAFAANASGSETIGLAELPTVALSVLVLLALSSHESREYAVRRRPRGPHLAPTTRDAISS